MAINEVRQEVNYGVNTDFSSLFKVIPDIASSIPKPAVDNLAHAHPIHESHQEFLQIHLGCNTPVNASHFGK